MSQVYFVSPARVKRDTALGSTVDEDIIHPYIQIAQDRHIWSALGTKLYDKLKDDIAGVDSATLTGAYKTLVEDYIQPALVQFVFTELAYVVRLRFSNNSITIADSEVGSQASVDDVKLVKEQAESIAMFYRQRMVDYLCDNTSSFPEYSQNTGSDLSPSTRNYYGGLNVYHRMPYSNRLKAYLQAIGDTRYNL
jgi:hypothetical protein